MRPSKVKQRYKKGIRLGIIPRPSHHTTLPFLDVPSSLKNKLAKNILKEHLPRAIARKALYNFKAQKPESYNTLQARDTRSAIDITMYWSNTREGNSYWSMMSDKYSGAPVRRRASQQGSR